jgi:hypothetical protein
MRPRLVLPLCVALPFLVLAAEPAAALPLAARAGADGPDPQGLLGVLLAVLLGGLAFVGIGAAVLVLRILLPALAASADAARERVSTRALLLSGVVPLAGAALLAHGIGQVGHPALGVAFLLLVGLPIALALLTGLLACVPHVGARALRADSRAGPFAQAALGALVVGLALVSWALPPLGFLLSLLVLGWFLATGLGVFLQRMRPTSAGRTPAASEPHVG